MMWGSMKQSGFTIIELLIGIAIIGVLAIIAIPAYQNYVIRAKMSEAILFADNVKTSVTEYYQSMGTMPDNNSQLGLSINNTTGRYVNGISVGAGGIITTTVSIEGVSGSLIFTPESE